MKYFLDFLNKNILLSFLLGGYSPPPIPAVARHRCTAHFSLLLSPHVHAGSRRRPVGPALRSAGWPACRRPRLHSCPRNAAPLRGGVGRRTRPLGSPARCRRWGCCAGRAERAQGRAAWPWRSGAARRRSPHDWGEWLGHLCWQMEANQTPAQNGKGREEGICD